MTADWLLAPMKELKFNARQLLKDNKKFPKHMTRLDDGDFVGQAQRSSVPFIECWRSRNYLCQVFDHGKVERLSICRAEVDLENRRWRDGLSWDEIEQIKNEVGRGDRFGVEIYPPNDRIVDVANMRHIWIWKDAHPLDFAW